MQPHQQLSLMAFELPRESYRIVASVEDEQRSIHTSAWHPLQRGAYLLRGYSVSLFGRMDPLDVHWSHPGVAAEADLGDGLVSPAGYDGLTRRVSGWMVVVSPLWTCFGIATRPRSGVYGIDWSAVLVVVDHRVAGQETLHRFLLDPFCAAAIAPALHHETSVSPSIPPHSTGRSHPLRCFLQVAVVGEDQRGSALRLPGGYGSQVFGHHRGAPDHESGDLGGARAGAVGHRGVVAEQAGRRATVETRAPPILFRRGGDGPRRFGRQQGAEVVREEAQLPGLAGRPDGPGWVHGGLGVRPAPVVADQTLDGRQVAR
jgi:hypothetical protein